MTEEFNPTGTFDLKEENKSKSNVELIDGWVEETLEFYNNNKKMLLYILI